MRTIVPARGVLTKTVRPYGKAGQQSWGVLRKSYLDYFWEGKNLFYNLAQLAMFVE